MAFDRNLKFIMSRVQAITLGDLQVDLQIMNLLRVSVKLLVLQIVLLQLDFESNQVMRIVREHLLVVRVYPQPQQQVDRKD